MTAAKTSIEQAVALHMFDMIVKKNEIEKRIGEIKKNYIYTDDDSEAEQMRIEWHYLAEEKRLMNWCIENITAYLRETHE